MTTLFVNGAARTVECEPTTPLLYALRNDLNLKGSRFGCGEGTCGACMVLVDGEPIPSCDLPIEAAEGKQVVTIEGLAAPSEASGSPMQLLQDAFIAEQAAQCGYCMTGILVSACALLQENPDPGRHEICAALDGNLCRCGSHWRVVRAVERAAVTLGQVAP